jgi:hypothetical protein
MGIATGRKAREVANYLRRKRPHVLVLTETKISTINLQSQYKNGRVPPGHPFANYEWICKYYSFFTTIPN